MPFLGILYGILRINYYKYSSYVVTLYFVHLTDFLNYIVSFIGFVTDDDDDDILLQVI